jgi:hypothetical protein
MKTTEEIAEELREALRLNAQLKKENTELSRQIAEIRTLGAKEYLEW